VEAGFADATIVVVVDLRAIPFGPYTVAATGWVVATDFDFVEVAARDVAIGASTS
jgi:hypothetical protein